MMLMMPNIRSIWAVSPVIPTLPALSDAECDMRFAFTELRYATVAITLKQITTPHPMG